MIITPQWFASFEEQMRIITEDAYVNLTKDLWWTRCAKQMTSETKRERLTWLITTAQIIDLIDGEMDFEQVMAHQHEYEHKFAGRGLKLDKSELEDKDANGIQAAAHWSQGIGAYSAYWPQEKIASAILANPKSYDGVAYFATNHPLNPVVGASGGTYSNLLSGAEYAIHDQAALDLAVKNLGNVLAHIRQVKTPNGKAPRHLKARTILHPPAMTSRVTQLLDAKFIAQSAESGTAGTADVSAVVSKFGLTAVECPELGSVFTGNAADDRTYYLVCDDLIKGELGAWIYSVREPFSVIYHGPMTTAQLARTREFQWTMFGRNVVAPGHPFAMYKCVGPDLS